MNAKDVSEFILNVCSLRPRPDRTRFNVLWFRIYQETAATIKNDTWLSCKTTPTGSASEFYLEPMLGHINDMDIMFHSPYRVAASSKETADKHGVGRLAALLQDEFPDDTCVKLEVFEMVPCDRYPGYCLLKKAGEMSICNNGDSRTHEFSPIPGEAWLSLSSGRGTAVAGTVYKGPAQKQFNAFRTTTEDPNLSVDFVLCIRCPVWPPQADQWPTRHRNNDWPMKADIDRIVRGGCDLVATVHPDCRSDSWMNEHQNRLSFSRAESILLNSWTPKQQVTYHVMRIISKEFQREIVGSDSQDQEMLTSYHVKTLMLWECERQSTTWWERCLVSICTDLLHTFGSWLAAEQFPMYFVEKYNLVDVAANRFSREFRNLTDLFSSTTSKQLTDRLVNNYLRKCAEKCVINFYYPKNVRSKSAHLIQQFVREVDRCDDVPQVLSEILRLRHKAIESKSWLDFDSIFFGLQELVTLRPLTLQSCLLYIEELPRIDIRLRDYFTALAFLHGAEKLNRGRYDFEWTQILFAAIRPEEQQTRYRSNLMTRLRNTCPCDVCMLLLALSMIQKDRPVANSRHQTIETEVLKSLLHMSLECKGRCVAHGEFMDCLIRSAAHLNLACLYFQTEHIETAVGHSHKVLSFQDQCKHYHPVQIRRVVKFDPFICCVAGLIALHRQVLNTAGLSATQSAELPPDYLSDDALLCYVIVNRTSITCAKKHKPTSQNYRQRFANIFRRRQRLFIADFLVYYKFRRIKFRDVSRKRLKAVKILTKQISLDFDRSRLSRLLIATAVHHLTAVRRIMSRDFRRPSTENSQAIVSSEFHALYAYRCQQYRECLYLVESMLPTLDFPVRTGSSVVSVGSPLLVLFDDDLKLSVCLAAICNRFARINKFNGILCQSSIVIHLLVKCRIKLNSSLLSLIKAMQLILRKIGVIAADYITELTVLFLTYRKAFLHLHASLSSLAPCKPEFTGVV